MPILVTPVESQACTAPYVWQRKAHLLGMAMSKDHLGGIPGTVPHAERSACVWLPGREAPSGLSALLSNGGSRQGHSELLHPASTAGPLARKTAVCLLQEV